MEEKIWLSPPHLGGAEINYIQEAFDQNWITTQGSNVDGFEDDLEFFLGGSVHVSAVTSGTAAIHLALMLLGVKDGDEVICQSFTFVASANPIIYLGAIPIFVDSERETWNMDPEFLEKAILSRINAGKKPKAIIVVCLFGMPYQVERIREIADKYSIPIVEDSAEALGSMYKGQKCGTFGDLSVLSFNGNKIITTSGGGALVTRTEEQKAKADFLSTQSKNVAPHYEHSEIGFNYGLSNICAGIGRGQMKVLDLRIIQRRENYLFYKSFLEGIPGVKLLPEPDENYFSNYWLTNILIDSKEAKCSREEVRIALLKENIEVRPLWKPLHLQPVFECYQYFGSNVSEELFSQGLCLPSGSNLTIEQKNKIEKVLLELLV
ncbi:aminotransferase class I/II-fold pyridoxal phosphate-dependent enzyme [Soonwooa sp.]|uniref:DegT/DnrJ/EryC1/StrS family aminotransferase n=1 Tax=Soonwooa sp. TaxID=1938592 RepID=UPI00263A139F|nr:aminotransferase class I/II-fold pyridoxal phosphate-dependent enzyme [Soonwooa sp.]